MAAETVDVEAIMMEIRNKVREDLSDRKPQSLPLTEGIGIRTELPTSILFSEQLQYMNEHWNGWLVAEEPFSNRPVVGKFILKAKQFIISTVWKYVLGKYFDNERVFQHNLVRYLNDNARYIDKRDTEVFDHLFKKIDSDIKALNERVDRLFEMAARERIALSDELEELKRSSQALSQFSQERPHPSTSQ